MGYKKGLCICLDKLYHDFVWMTDYTNRKLNRLYMYYFLINIDYYFLSMIETFF